MSYGFTQLGGGEKEEFPAYPEPFVSPPDFPGKEPKNPESEEKFEVELEENPEEEYEESGFSIWLKWGVFFIVAFGILWVFFYGLPFSESNTIGPKGGEITLDDGAKLIIPEGALEDEITFEIEKIEKENAVTDLYRFGPDGVKFLKPATVIIPFHEENLKENSAADIALWYGFSEKNLTTKLMTRFDLDEKTVESEVTAL